VRSHVSLQLVKKVLSYCYEHKSIISDKAPVM